MLDFIIFSFLILSHVLSLWLNLRFSANRRFSCVVFTSVQVQNVTGLSAFIFRWFHLANSPCCSSFHSCFICLLSCCSYLSFCYPGFSNCFPGWYWPLFFYAYIYFCLLSSSFCFPWCHHYPQMCSSFSFFPPAFSTFPLSAPAFPPAASAYSSFSLVHSVSGFFNLWSLFCCWSWFSCFFFGSSRLICLFLEFSSSSCLVSTNKKHREESDAEETFK